MQVSSTTLERLEWNRVLDAIGAHLRTPMGRELCRGLAPASRIADAERLQRRVEEMRRVHIARGRLPMAEVIDPAEIVRFLGVARRSLPGEHIYETLHLLVVARDVALALREIDPDDFEELGPEWARIPDLDAVVGAIEGNITSSGQLEDRASPELGRLRREIRQLSERLEGVLDRLMQADWTDPVLRDRYITVRNDRYVVPVRTDTPHRFHGIVHGRSGSEKTLYVEPIETVEINNQLVRLRDDEQAEVDRILASYTELLRGCRQEIAQTAQVLGEIDLLESLARWADENDACLPELGTEGLSLEAARHPVLEAILAGRGGGLVPLDVDLPRDLRVLVISGPNAGGKTVALKTVGLLSLMAHAGLPVPAKSARLPFFGMLLTDIGDEQSIEDGLSTFSSHVRNLAEMLRTARAPGLVLVDEVGAGTDPAEGAALGTAIVDRLRRRGIHVVATTHHQAIKTWAYRTEGVLNAACEFDESTLAPTYRLVPGVAGSSIGLTMARQLGLEDEVVEDARARLDPAGVEVTRALESVRSLASDLENQRAELVQRRRAVEEELSAERRELEARERKREERWRRQMDDLLRSFRAEAQRMISKIADSRDRRAIERERTRRERELRDRFSEEMRQGRPAATPPEGWEPREGELVLVVSIGKKGTVRRVKQDRADVLLGQSVFTVSASDLMPAGERQAAAEQIEAGRARRPSVPRGVEATLEERTVSPELHLIGQRVEEGLASLDKYLDDLSLAGLSRARIIHGVGTGRLREAVRAHLDEHPSVVSWREAEPQEGGMGATLIVLEQE